MRTADSVHIMLFKVRPCSPCVERSLYLCNVDFIGADVDVIDADVDVMLMLMSLMSMLMLMSL